MRENEASRPVTGAVTVRAARMRMDNSSPGAAARIIGTCLMFSLGGFSARAADAPTSTPGSAEAKPVVLEPYGVSAKPVGSLGFSVQILKDGLSQKAIDVTVDRVAPNSEAARKGLAPLTQILSIDGKDVQEFVASFAKGSELNMKLMNRKKGDHLTLEVMVLGSRESRFINLTEGSQALGPDRREANAEEATPGAIRVGSGGSPNARN